MEQFDNKKGQEKFIVTDNSGQVYYNNSNNAVDSRTESLLGDCECAKCFTRKPFERVRWDAGQKLFVCLDCLSKGHQSR